MKPCDAAERLQALLDGELDAAAESDVRRHLLECRECAAELALYERVFASLDAIPMAEPSPALAGRILDRVLPSRARARWLRALGWGYGAAAAASAAAALGLLVQPATRAWIGALGVEASQRVAQAAVFVVDAIAVTLVQIAGGWVLLEQLGVRLGPLVRALNTVLSRPGVDVTLALATLATALLVIWLRPRERDGGRASSSREIEHASLLAL